VPGDGYIERARRDVSRGGRRVLSPPDLAGARQYAPLRYVSYLTDRAKFPAQNPAITSHAAVGRPAVTTDHIRVPTMNADSPPSRNAFDASTTSILITAFEGAWAAVLKSGSPLASSENAAETREFLARYIIDHVEAGERDPNKLIDDALISLAKTR
jgi:hypothetical protein